MVEELFLVYFAKNKDFMTYFYNILKEILAYIKKSIETVVHQDGTIDKFQFVCSWFFIEEVKAKK